MSEYAAAFAALFQAVVAVIGMKKEADRKAEIEAAKVNAAVNALTPPPNAPEVTQ